MELGNHVANDDDLDPLHADPRFQRLVRRASKPHAEKLDWKK
jgi:hypothetical protein